MSLGADDSVPPAPQDNRHNICPVLTASPATTPTSSTTPSTGAPTTECLLPIVFHRYSQPSACRTESRRPNMLTRVLSAARGQEDAEVAALASWVLAVVQIVFTFPPAPMKRPAEAKATKASSRVYSMRSCPLSSAMKDLNACFIVYQRRKHGRRRISYRKLTRGYSRPFL